MVNTRAGCIINISSLLGLKGGKGSAVYAASKAGVLGMHGKESVCRVYLLMHVGLTRALAAELGRERHPSECDRTRLHRDRHDSRYVHFAEYGSCNSHYD